MTALAVAASGCVTVEPQDKEYLADPAMTFGSEGSLGSQTGASFYSDDYATEPRGQYWTGDRELSEMSPWAAGLRLNWTAPRTTRGRSDSSTRWIW